MTGTRPAPAALDAELHATDRSIIRAAYGLVADEYAVVGHTPNVTRDEARELALAVGVGDLTTTVDDALSFLDIPGWGLVCTRYTTERDARSRVALASDSVAVDAATFAALRGDPFRCFPRRQDRPTTTGELAVPRFSASTPAAEAERLADARRADPELLRALLGALLAGPRVLYVAPDDVPVGVLQSLVLLLPPSLRRLMTFQTLAARAPMHEPRLTIAERRFADFASVAWTRELPRQQGSGDTRADATADALLALAPAALAAAHALYEDLAPDAPVAADALLDEMAHVARYGALTDALGALDAAAALQAIGTPRDEREMAVLIDVLLAGLEPDALASAIVGATVDRSPAIRAATAVATALVPRLTSSDAAASHVVRATLAATDGVRWDAEDAGAQSLRAVLAVGAAWLGDAERFVRLADARAPWPAFATERSNDPAARTTASTLAAVVRANGGDADRCAAALDALRSLATSAPATRNDGAALALGIVRVAFARHGDQATPEPLDRIADALHAFWDAVAPAARDDALRTWIDASAPVDARVRAAGESIRALAGRGASDAELAGWIGAVAVRAIVSDADARPVAAAITAAERAAVDRAIGALLDVAAPRGIPLHGAWPDVVSHAGTDARRALLVRTLARAAADDVRPGELATTCAALADLGLVLDAPALDGLAAGLTRWAATLPATRSGAVRLDTALAALGALADATDANAFAARVLDAVPAGLRERVMLRRLATAAIAIEGTRDADAWSAGRAALGGPAGSELSAGERNVLRTFFGVERGALGWIARLLGRNGTEGTR